MLLDQSFHMTGHHIEAADVKCLVGDMAVNSMANLRQEIAEHVEICNQEGRYIADAIMFILDDRRVSIVNRPTNRDWVRFHIETGKCDVDAVTDYRAPDNTGRRTSYRFEVRGEDAW